MYKVQAGAQGLQWVNAKQSMSDSGTNQHSLDLTKKAKAVSHLGFNIDFPKCTLRRRCGGDLSTGTSAFAIEFALGEVFFSVHQSSRLSMPAVPDGQNNCILGIER